MYELPKKLKNLVPYIPNNEDYEIYLDANESFLTIPKDIKNKIIQMMEKLELNRYPDSDSKNVIEAFANFFEINKDVVMAGNGSDELISIILNNFANYQDNILLTTPDFSMYEFYAKQSGLTIKKFEKKENFTVEELVKITKENQCKILLLSNPCNPSSLCIKKEDILKIIKNLDCLVVIDEAYMDFSNESIIKETEKFDNVIVLKTCSKAFGIAGIRLGFAISNQKINTCLKAVKSPYNISLVTQKIGEIILSEKEFLLQSINEIKKETEFLYEELKKLEEQYFSIVKLNPTNTNFIFIDCYVEKRAKNCIDILKKNKIAIRLIGKYVRISTGNRTENKKVIRAIKEWLIEEERQNEKL